MAAGGDRPVGLGEVVGQEPWLPALFSMAATILPSVSREVDGGEMGDARQFLEVVGELAHFQSCLARTIPRIRPVVKVATGTAKTMALMPRSGP